MLKNTHQKALKSIFSYIIHEKIIKKMEEKRPDEMEVAKKKN